MLSKTTNLRKNYENKKHFYVLKKNGQFIKLSIVINVGKRSHDIPDSTVAAIIGLKQREVLQMEIATQVGYSPSTVSKVMCREGSRCSNCGRKRSTTLEDDRSCSASSARADFPLNKLAYQWKEVGVGVRRNAKFPQSVMVWGALCATGVSRLCFLRSTLTATVYQDVLELTTWLVLLNSLFSKPLQPLTRPK